MADDSFKLRRAIEAGSALADPHAALRAIAEAAPASPVEGRSLLWPEGREHRQLLAGILLRASRIAEADRLLNGGPAVAIGPSDAFVVDPGFARIGGHRYASNLLYRQIIVEAGLSVTVVRSRGAIEGDRTASIGALTPFLVGELFSETPEEDTVPALNALHLLEFQRVLPSIRPRLLVAHTAGRNFFEGLCGYIASATPVGPASVLIGIIEARGLKDGRALPDPVQASYRRGIAILRAIPGLRLLIVVETPEIARFIGDDLPPSLVLVAPYIGAQLATLAARRSETGPRTVGFVGQTRKERGAHLIPGIARSTLAARPGGSVWRVQLEVDRLAGRFQEWARSELAALADGERFRLLGVDLSTTEYHELARSIDIMVMPYAKRYDASASGVAAECLRMGCVQVVPAGSSMARSAEEAGAGAVAFVDRTVEGITAAVVEAIDRYDDLAVRSMAAAARLPGEESYRRIVEFIRSA